VYSSTASGASPARRSTRNISYFVFFAIFAAVVFGSHLWGMTLPYFWDEAGQFIPAALDLLHGSWIPRSVAPNVHPPAVMAYLAAWWKLAGFHPAVTRAAMLLVASATVLSAFLLAIELLREARGASAFLAAALVCVSPVFFTQSLLAQLDAPAMLFATLALLLFLQDRIRAAAVACVALVLVKETGAVVPMVFFLWLARERRWRDAAWFLAAPAALSVWILALHMATGHWLGNSAFLHYNVFYPLHPARFGAALLRRIYYLFFANFHWMGTQAILLAWRTSGIFRSRAWRIAIWTSAAQVFAVTVCGGAVLERYLLPVIPVLYIAMTAGLTLLRRTPRLICSALLLLGVAAGNFINPPYPFPYENNLAAADFLRLHQDTAHYLSRRFPDSVVATAWPMTAELVHPELGFIDRPMAVETLRSFAPADIQSVDWSVVDVAVVYSRRWDPNLNLMHWPLVERFWSRFAGYVPGATMTQSWSSVPFPSYAHFERRGQWVDVYAKPGADRPGRVLAESK
jgi:4-amino-4-deoxy-L-arabinose transferase-like glycosyltransferase